MVKYFENMKRKKITDVAVLIGALAGCGALVSCEKAVTTTEVPQLVELVVTPPSATATPGQDVQFTTRGRYSDGNTQDIAVTYSTTAGATVSAAGVFRATTAGNYVVTATAANGMTGTGTVLVSTTPVNQTGVSLTPANTSLQPGGTQQFTLMAAFSNSSTANMTSAATFSATGGTITSGGLYTAGTTAGTYRVIATQSGFADTSTITITAATPPPPSSGSYTKLVGDDWSSYRDKASLKAADYFYWVDAGGRDVYQFLDLKPDPTFGQVVRIMFPQNSGSSGSSPRLAKDFPAPIDKMWYRWRMKFTPGWTSAGPDPAGWANSYKIAFWLWDIYGGRGEVEYSNTNQYITGTGFTGNNGSISYNETLLPGSAPDFGNTGSEWTDGEWYEFVVYWEKASNTSYRQYYWRRKLTQGGVIVNNNFIFHGYRASGSTALPKVKGIELGINRNKNNPTDMYISWGPWEVVDGSKYSNPFGMKFPDGSPLCHEGHTPAC